MCVAALMAWYKCHKAKNACRNAFVSRRGVGVFSGVGVRARRVCPAAADYAVRAAGVGWGESI